MADGAKKIIVPSAYLRGIVFAWGVDVSKMKVIHNGFHMEPISKTPSALRKKLHLSGSIIVSVGRLVSWKGMRELIEIMPAITILVPLAKLVIVGDGPEKNNLAETAKAFGLGDRVIFTGQLIQEKVFEYVKAADLFVLNTSYEGFSHQIIETMALGTPVITTAVGGNPEIIRNNENGILISPGAKESLLEVITGLLLDPKRAETLAKTAKRDVEKFTDEVMLLHLVEELQKN